MEHTVNGVCVRRRNGRGSEEERKRKRERERDKDKPMLVNIRPLKHGSVIWKKGSVDKKICEQYVERTQHCISFPYTGSSMLLASVETVAIIFFFFWKTRNN